MKLKGYSVSQCENQSPPYLEKHRRQCEVGYVRVDALCIIWGQQTEPRRHVSHQNDHKALEDRWEKVSCKRPRTCGTIVAGALHLEGKDSSIGEGTKPVMIIAQQVGLTWNKTETNSEKVATIIHSRLISRSRKAKASGFYEKALVRAPPRSHRPRHTFWQTSIKAEKVRASREARVLTSNHRKKALIDRPYFTFWLFLTANQLDNEGKMLPPHWQRGIYAKKPCKSIDVKITKNQSMLVDLFIAIYEKAHTRVLWPDKSFRWFQR